MENLKIRVANSSESKEVQELFFELGCSWNGNKKIQELSYPVNSSYWLCTKNGMGLFNCIKWGTGHDSGKLITLPELRDLVVLKRNDRKDANVSDENCLYDLYLTKSKELYFYDCGKNKWILSNLNGDDIYYESLKPIEKPMKEWLNTETYEYKKAVDMGGHSKWIEIPEWAVAYADHKNGHGFFYDSFCKIASFYNIVWSRHTHPEELPFIDDESYNPNYDGAEQEEFESLNDQYAEIEKVRQTLNQRQEQYGSFEDVAMITEQMVDVMRKGYYENLAYNQKMALYMICSKMARIVNGNPNHKDSWHDIAGYATLIDNELVSEKDMPF